MISKATQEINLQKLNRRAEYANNNEIMSSVIDDYNKLKLSNKLNKNITLEHYASRQANRDPGKENICELTQSNIYFKNCKGFVLCKKDICDKKYINLRIDNNGNIIKNKTRFKNNIKSVDGIGFIDKIMHIVWFKHIGKKKRSGGTQVNSENEIIALCELIKNTGVTYNNKYVSVHII